MRTSHFATIQVIVPPDSYTAGEGTSSAGLKTVGMAQNINIDDNFGSRGENTIGTPFPVLAPGYMQSTIRMEKATIDGADFRNLGAFNPLYAHVGKTYRNPLTVPTGMMEVTDNNQTYPFMFVIGVKNRVSNSYSKSNISYNNQPANSNGTDARSSTFGTYVCVLQSASISMSSNQAVIMDSVNAVARPINGTWLNSAIKSAYVTDGQADPTVGLSEVIYNVLWGYNS